MKIIHICCLIILPCGSAKTGTPVIRFFSVLCLAPDIIITVRVILIFSALHKPPVLIGTVVDDQIHDDLNAKFVCLGKHFIEISECTKLRHDIPVITDIVTVVIVRGLIDRG